jgi:hypothetical protein
MNSSELEITNGAAHLRSFFYNPGAMNDQT